MGGMSKSTGRKNDNGDAIEQLAGNIADNAYSVYSTGRRGLGSILDAVPGGQLPGDGLRSLNMLGSNRVPSAGTTGGVQDRVEAAVSQMGNTTMYVGQSSSSRGTFVYLGPKRIVLRTTKKSTPQEVEAVARDMGTMLKDAGLRRSVSLTKRQLDTGYGDILLNAGWRSNRAGTSYQSPR